MPNDILRRGFLIFAGSLLTACAIHKDVSYFSPIPLREVQVMSTFRGLNEIVKLQVDEKVQLRIIMFDQPSNSSLRLLFDLPSGQSVRFETAEIVATPSNGEREIVARIESIRANYIVDGVGSPRYLTASEQLEGASYQYKQTFGQLVTVPRGFEIETKFSARLPDHFRIRLPSMRLADKIVSLPEMEFRRKTGSAYVGTPP